jgi:hypothetical protein
MRPDRPGAYAGLILAGRRKHPGLAAPNLHHRIPQRTRYSHGFLHVPGKNPGFPSALEGKNTAIPRPSVYGDKGKKNNKQGQKKTDKIKRF